MSEQSFSPLIRRADDIEYNSVDAAPGMKKGVLIDESRGAPHFAIRRFVLEPGARVPRHTNEVEHEQYVLDGEYVVGLSEEILECDDGTPVEDGIEYTVSAGDSILIPAGTVHWYRNDGDEPGAFICAVPNGDDSIEVIE